MKRIFNLVEILNFCHKIEIEAESEGILNEIEEQLSELLASGDVEDKELLFSVIEDAGGEYVFTEDTSPEIEFE